MVSAVELISGFGFPPILAYEVVIGSIISIAISAALSLAIGLLMPKKKNTQLPDVLPNLSTRGATVPLVRGRRRVG